MGPQNTKGASRGPFLKGLQESRPQWSQWPQWQLCTIEAVFLPCLEGYPAITFFTSIGEKRKKQVIWAT